MKNQSLIAGAAGLALFATGAANAETVYVLEDVGTSQQLSFFDSEAVGTLSERVAITGLNPGQQLLGIDFRPATGQLYGLSSGDAVVTIDVNTGVATRLEPGFTDSPSGSFYGFDFNPVIDKIRIVSNTDTNFVADPDSGDANIASTTPVFFAAGDPNETANPTIVGSAYTNSNAGAQSTQLYGIDSNLDILVTQANNAGTLETVGSLGVDIIDIGEFDISGATGIAYLAAIPNGETESVLYTVDLSTGALTAIGVIEEGLTVAGIAVAPGQAQVIPTPAALPAGLLLLSWVAGRRRKSQEA